MKSSKSISDARLKSIATHSLVAAIFTNPYVILLLADIYRIVTNDRSSIVYSQSMIYVMATISTIAFIIAAIASTAYFIRGGKQGVRRGILYAITAFLVYISWPLSLVYLPLGTVSLFVALLVVFMIFKKR